MHSSSRDFDFSGLSTPERLLLAQELLDSVVAEAMPLTPEQLAEVDRRIAEIDSGEVVCIPWEEARKQLLPRS